MSAAKPAPKFFRAVKGITEGFVHHVEHDVFAASDEILAHFERTGGVDADGSVLYVPANEAEAKAHDEKVAAEAEAARAASTGKVVEAPKASDDLAGTANT